MGEWSDWLSSQLAQIEAASQWRRTVPFEGSVHATVQGRSVINFASNDYLGLGSHPRVCEAACAAIAKWGTSSAASRLVTGTRPLHAELESQIAAWQGRPRALVFPTGYAANLGVMTTLGSEGATIFSDALNHASIIDGCRLAKARTTVFAHNDVTHLDSLLSATPGRKIVVTEAIFSMDGDAAPLHEMSVACARHGALLVIDEAHAALGNRPDLQCEHVIVGTLSKTFGALGGWVAGTADVIDLLVNRARTFIFTTALSPGDAAAALAALTIYRSAEGEHLRQQLRQYIDAIRPAHPSAIIPLILGSETAALDAARALLELGIYIPAIRPPTVPRGTSRLRLTLSAAHSNDMIARLQAALDAVIAPANSTQ
jgi:8-amino-7-oxononanoate synthase